MSDHFYKFVNVSDIDNHQFKRFSNYALFNMIRGHDYVDLWH